MDLWCCRVGVMTLAGQAERERASFSRLQEGHKVDERAIFFLPRVKWTKLFAGRDFS